MPDVPTIAEAGARSASAASTSTPGSASSAPAQLPADVTARLNKAFVDALDSAELKARLASLLAEPMPMPPERFAAFVKERAGQVREGRQGLRGAGRVGVRTLDSQRPFHWLLLTGTHGDSAKPTCSARSPALLVEALNLDIAAEAIDPEAPLYGEGLGLDSIDILEVALVVSQRYGFQLRSDDEDNVRIFKSLASLAEHIAAQPPAA